MLRKALAGLPESQEDVLVMRELEGLPYERIATRTGLSSSAVESMLFRARRTLKDEFERVSSGSRCEEIQGWLPAVAGGSADIKRRKLIRHMNACSGCRRAAYSMGYPELAQESSEYRTLRSRIAAWLPPIPFITRPGIGFFSSGSETLASGPAKLAALAAAAILAAGGGVAAERVIDDDSAGNKATPASGTSSASGSTTEGRSQDADSRRAGRRADRKRNRGDRSNGGSKDGSQTALAPSGSGTSGGGESSTAPAGGKSGSSLSVNGIDTPVGNPGEQGGQLLDDTTQQLGETLNQTQQQLNHTLGQTQQQVQGTLPGTLP
jgi:hypothetical protein